MPSAECNVEVNTFLSVWEMMQDWQSIATLLDGIEESEQVSSIHLCDS